MADKEFVKQLRTQLQQLQEAQSFQEQAIAELNQALFDQQKQVLLLQEENRYLAKQLEALQQGGSDGETVVETPPHY